MKFPYFPLMILAFSCASFSDQNEQLSSAWKGRPVEELISHRYLKTLTMSKHTNNHGEELFYFRDINLAKSQGHCSEIGGCRSILMNYCDNIFTIKDEKVLAFDQTGICPERKKLLSPLKISVH